MLKSHVMGVQIFSDTVFAKEVKHFLLIDTVKNWSDAAFCIMKQRLQNIFKQIIDHILQSV